jgi:hypothetical protein
MKAAAAAALLTLALAAPAAAQPTCTSPSRRVQGLGWDFCAIAPVSSTGSSGSGVELHDVYYNGHLVFKRAHAPILNVKYAPGGCGGANLCYRDWSDEEAPFEAVTATGPVSGGPGAWAEVVVPPVTVCEAGGGADVGSFRGVATERLPDRLNLTSQMRAGWYRYTMRWSLFADGRVEGWFGFSAVAHSCVGFDHTHHNYWRLDLDIDGPADDAVELAPPAGVPLPPRPLVLLGGESARINNGAATYVVRDQRTGRGFRLLHGSSVGVDGFSVADSWFLRYAANEVTDSGQSGPACAIKFANYVTPAQSLEQQDVVMWVRGGQFHAAGDLDDCHTTSFMLEPVGDWGAAAPGVAARKPTEPSR